MFAALDDLVDDISGLARVLHLRAVDGAFLVEEVGRNRGARDVRAAAQAEVLVRGDLLRPDARRREAPGAAEGLEEGLHDVPGRRLRRQRSEDDC